jgi:D-alanine-D-alanine ligase
VQKKFNQVGVLMGGPSAERDVSLKSGAAVARGLRAAGYRVEEVVLETESLDLPAGMEAVFIALHGTYGEDGTVQALLRDRGMPYIGAGPESSRLAFDKVATKQRLGEVGIPTPPYEVLRSGDPRTLDLPVILKPSRQGSSIGLHRVDHDDEWEPARQEAMGHGGELLVEAFIEGRELTVGVVCDEVMPVVEIRAPGGNYDYTAKYTAGMTEYLAPAPLDPKMEAACREISLCTYRTLGCEGLARIDLRMSPQDELFVLELNTIPGFTETSLLPKAAAAAGIDFSTLCSRILESASVH